MQVRAFQTLTAGFLFSVSIGLHAGEIVINPEAGGLKKTFKEVDGKAISHPIDFPQDGMGTVLYLKDVCRALGHDEIVSFEPLKAQSYDASSQQWLDVDVVPRIYKSITCTVYVK